MTTHGPVLPVWSCGGRAARNGAAGAAARETEPVRSYGGPRRPVDRPIRRWPSRRRTALPTVLVSAAVGVPPLAVGSPSHAFSDG
jgi:hypothetical protein